MLSNDIAALIGFACETALWGAYTVLFLLSLGVLFWTKRPRSLNPIVVFANFVMYICCTTHFALEFNHFYTTLRATGVPHYADETKVLFGADIFISICDLFGDFFLLYRCWHVWGGNWLVIIVPVLSAISGFACAMEVMHLLLTVNPTAPVPPASLVPLGIAGFVLPLCTNVLITALIVGRVWWQSRGTNPKELGVLRTGRSVRKATEIVIESGALYLVAQLIFVVLYSIKHPAEAIAAVAAVQIYGIAPTLIIIRVGMGVSTDYHSRTNESTHISWARPRTQNAVTTGYSTSTHAPSNGETYLTDIERKGSDASDKYESSRTTLPS